LVTAQFADKPTRDVDVDVNNIRVQNAFMTVAQLLYIINALYYKLYDIGLPLISLRHPVM